MLVLLNGERNVAQLFPATTSATVFGIGILTSEISIPKSVLFFHFRDNFKGKKAL